MQNYSPVTHRQIGEIPGITGPVHTPCLLEQMGVIQCDKAGKVLMRRRTGLEWERLLADYRDNRSPYEWDQIVKMSSEYIPA